MQRGKRHILAHQFEIPPVFPRGRKRRNEVYERVQRHGNTNHPNRARVRVGEDLNAYRTFAAALWRIS